MTSTKGLVIVESPAKAKTINKYLHNKYNIASSVGHIIDLPQKKLGVDIDNDFSVEYVNMPGKSKVINNLKKLAKNASSVYIATDPDREGEAIAAHIESILKNGKTKIHRVTFNEITKSAVQTAMENPRKIDENMVNAQQARRVLDRLVGYKVSPFLWRTIYKGLSAGRVQSVALRIICEREKEIQDFKPEEYWNLSARLETPKKEEFAAKLTKENGKKIKIPDNETANRILKELREKKFLVSEKKVKKIKRRPYPSFTTSTLQQVANRMLGMSSKRTMMIAQQLYEGIELDGETTGLITYMRTDSLRISSEAIGAARSLIYNNWGDDYLPEKPNFYKSKKSAQDAHEAIRPAQIDEKHSPKNIKKYLNRDQMRLYQLIWNRFISSQMVPAEVEKTTIIINANPYELQTEGEVVRFRGFLQVFEDKDEDESEDSPEKLPKFIEEGMILKLLEPIAKQMFTQPSPRFTESSLVKILDQLGIGRPSTYAQIISTILQRKYATIIEKKLNASEIGMTVNKILIENFPDIFNVEFTAFMEKELDKIASGDLTYLKAMKDFFKPFSKDLEEAQASRDDIKESLQEKTEITCENCGKPMVIKWGRNGRFYACSGFPECKTTKPLEEEAPKETDFKCSKCGSPMVLRKGRFGDFLACSDYPKCKTTMAVPTGTKCPKDDCGGDVVKRQSRRGKVFYGCSNYPKCDFAAWDKPVNTTCKECNNNYLLEKNTKTKGHHFFCPNCKSTFNTEDLQNENSA